jgi:hypothetical protein
MGELSNKQTAFNPMSNEQRRHIFYLFKQLGIGEEQRDEYIMEWTHGRAWRMSELQFIDAMNIIKYLKGLFATAQQRPASQKRPGAEAGLDTKRKGLLKAIFRWLELQGKKASMEYVIGIACRAGGVCRLNELSEKDLTRLYAEFCRKQKAQELINDESIQFSNN